MTTALDSIAPVPAPQDVTLDCPTLGCRTVISLPIVWQPSRFDPSAATATVHTANLDEHLRHAHPATWRDDRRSAVVAPPVASTRTASAGVLAGLDLPLCLPSADRTVVMSAVDRGVAVDVPALARDYIAERPGVSTGELLVHLAPYTEVTRVSLVSALHRHGRSYGYGQDDDFGWFTVEANDYIAGVVDGDRSTKRAEVFHQARAALGGVVRAGRALTAVPAELIPALEDAGVRVYERPALLGGWFSSEQHAQVVEVVSVPCPSVLDVAVLATPRAMAVLVRERLLEGGRRDLAMVLDPDEFPGVAGV